jgi:DNA-binding NtrC family response regulator
MEQSYRTQLVVIDDDIRNLELVCEALQQPGLKIEAFDDPKRGLDHVLRERPAIVLTDLVMPHFDGMEVLRRVMAADPAIEVILMTANYTSESAVAAIKEGASDYLEKPIKMDRLRERIQVVLAEAETRHQASEIDRRSIDTFRFEGIVGRSPLMLEMFARIRRVAPHFRAVLVSGATGTGKESVARALAKLSPAATGPLVVCNCAALTESLLESELFGYVKGAFTGALQDKMGLFEHAHNGVLFLDEIGELSLSAQAKLLRVLQDHEVQRVGSAAVRKINVRVIAATNRNLRVMVAERAFREDLFYRLSMVEIKLPKLSERKEDLPLLQRHFLERFSHEYNKSIDGITRRAQAMLSRHGWPGNVRELENAIGNACMMSDGPMLDVKDFPPLQQDANDDAGFSGDSMSLEDVQKVHILRVLRSVGGNKQRAAEVLGIARVTLYSFLKKAAEDSKTVH